MRTEDPNPALTPRQIEVLHLCAQGMSAKQIAVALAITTRTVEFHKNLVLYNLGVQNIQQAIARCAEIRFRPAYALKQKPRTQEKT